MVFCRLLCGGGRASGRETAQTKQPQTLRPCLKFSFKKSGQAVVLPHLCILSLFTKVSMQPVLGWIPVLQTFLMQCLDAVREGMPS